MTIEHEEAPLGDRHPPHDFEYADAAEREAAIITDIKFLKRLALQLDDGSYWRLSAISPDGIVPATWVAAKAAPTAHGHTWGEVSDKPATFPPEAHEHTTDAVTEGSNLYHTAARVRDVLLDGISFVTNAAIAAGDSILVAFGKLQRQITELIAALAGKTSMTGFPLNASGGYDVVPTYNETTRTVTLTPTGATFDVFVGGTKYTKTGAQSIVHAATGARRFIYYDETGTLVDSATAWDLLKHAPVYLIFQDPTNGRRIPNFELHAAGRDLFWHRNQHTNEGTKISAAGAVTGYTLATATDAAVTPGIGATTLHDEEIILTTDALPDGGPYTFIERVGASGEWQITRSNSFPLLLSGNTPQINELSGGVWGRTNVTNNLHFATWAFAIPALPPASITPTPSATEQFLFLSSQVQGSQATIDALDLSGIAWGELPIMEFAPLYKFVWQFQTANGGSTRCKLISVTRVIGTAAQIQMAQQTAASGITFTPTGGIAATNVQAALAELDSEKVSTPTAVATTYQASGTTTLAYSPGATYHATAATGPTTWAITGLPAAGTYAWWNVELTNGGSQTQTWFTGCKWDGGLAPSDLPAAGTSIFTFYTRDGGTTIRAFKAAGDSK